MPKHPRSNDLLPSSLQESAAIPLPTWSSASECAKRLTQRPELASKHLHKQKRILPFQSENLTKSFALKKTQNFKSLIFRPPPPFFHTCQDFLVLFHHVLNVSTKEQKKNLPSAKNQQVLSSSHVTCPGSCLEVAT